MALLKSNKNAQPFYLTKFPRGKLSFKYFSKFDIIFIIILKNCTYFLVNIYHYAQIGFKISENDKPSKNYEDFYFTHHNFT